MISFMNALYRNYDVQLEINCPYASFIYYLTLDITDISFSYREYNSIDPVKLIFGVNLHAG